MSSSDLLEQLVSASAFVPSNRQIRARDAFHQANPTGLPDSPTPSILVEMGAPQALIKWWNTPGFSDWWCAPSWEIEESKRLLLQAMSRVSEILQNENNAPTVLSAAREAREIYTKLNASKAEKFADEEVSNMDKRQLEEYIRRKTAVISGS